VNLVHSLPCVPSTWVGVAGKSVSESKIEAKFGGKIEFDELRTVKMDAARRPKWSSDVQVNSELLTPRRIPFLQRVTFLTVLTCS